jgi:hypothetical protein
MNKARYTEATPHGRAWMDDQDIAALAMWRDTMPRQWQRFTIGVRVP